MDPLFVNPNEISCSVLLFCVEPTKLTFPRLERHCRFWPGIAITFNGQLIVMQIANFPTLRQSKAIYKSLGDVE